MERLQEKIVKNEARFRAALARRDEEIADLRQAEASEVERAEQMAQQVGALKPLFLS